MTKEEQKQHLIDMMQEDEELKLYDVFNDEKRQGVKELIDKYKQDDENYLDSFGVTKTQFEVYRNFNKQKTLEEAAESYTIDFATMSAFKLGANWQEEQDKQDKDIFYLNGYVDGSRAQAKLMYSEECLEVAFFEGRENNLSFIEWFEQFKKKQDETTM